MSALSFEICTCTCHDYPDGTVMHCMPCCSLCLHCGQNIRRGWETEHEERCIEEREKLGLPLNLYTFGELTTLEELVGRTFQKQMQDDRENSPAVQFLRECEERERKLGK